MLKLKYISLIILGLIVAIPTFAQSNDHSLANGQIKITSITAQRAGNEVVLAMQLMMDDLTLKTNRFMAFTPVIEGKDGEVVEFTPFLLSGRRQHMVFEREGIREYNGAIEMRRNNNTIQQLDYLQSVTYQSWMSGGNIRIIEDLCGCGKSLAQDITPLCRFDYQPEILIAFVEPEVEAVKTRKEEGQAYLDFPVNRTEIYPAYRRNPEELRKIIATVDLVKNDPFTTITDISIHGYASPEGSYSNNVRLAAGRAEALKEYVRLLYNFPDSIFHVTSTPEDWEGLRQFVANSQLAEKEELLAIIDSDLAPDPKDAALKRKFPKLYTWMLEEWYPALRHSDYVVQYVVRSFNLEEARQVLITRPQLLSLQEIFMVALSYPTDAAEYTQAFEIAAHLYPNDETANLNAGILALKRDSFISAEKYLDKAGDSAQAVHARGVLALKQQQYKIAEPLLQQAVEEGVPEAKANW